MDRHEISENVFRQLQSDRGKRGGVRNRGFTWTNDGVKSYKYTQKQKSKESVEGFLENNPTYFKGRI